VPDTKLRSVDLIHPIPPGQAGNREGRRLDAAQALDQPVHHGPDALEKTVPEVLLPFVTILKCVNYTGEALAVAHGSGFGPVACGDEGES